MMSSSQVSKTACLAAALLIKHARVAQQPPWRSVFAPHLNGACAAARMQCVSDVHHLLQPQDQLRNECHHSIPCTTHMNVLSISLFLDASVHSSEPVAILWPGQHLSGHCRPCLGDTAWMPLLAWESGMCMPNLRFSSGVQAQRRL